MPADMNVQYPVYAAAFVDDNRLVVGGGGGEGNNGIPNKLSMLRVDSDTLSISLESELELPSDQDNPTSMAATSQNLFVGMNEGTSKKKLSESNKHLRNFDFTDSLKEISAVQGFESLQDDTYQRVTVAAKDTLAIASSGIPAEVVIFRGNATNRIFTDQEVGDLAISPDGRHVAICCAQRITVVSSDSGKKIAMAATGDEDPKRRFNFARVAFVNSEEIAVAANSRRKESAIHMFMLPSGDESKLIDAGKCKVPYISAITVLAANSNFITVGGVNGGLVVFDASNLKVVSKKREVHKFPITATTLNPTGNVAATTSLDGSVHIHKLHKSSSISFYIWLSILILLIGFLWARPTNSLSGLTNHSQAPAQQSQYSFEGSANPGVTAITANPDSDRPASDSTEEPILKTDQEGETTVVTDHTQPAQEPVFTVQDVPHP